MPLPLFALIDNWRATPPDASKVDWVGKFVYAHRGVHGAGVPENSPTGFAEAIQRGLGIECDVQESRGGQPVVFHDWDLDRLTDESGAVDRRSAGELGATVLSGSADHIPTLRQLLNQVSGRVPILIEVKSRREMNVSGFCQAIRRDLEGYRGPHAVMSFDPRVSRWFADRSPRTVRGLVVTEGDDRSFLGRIKRRLSLWRARPDFLAYDIRDLPSRFASAQRKRGIPVLTWTVKSPADRARAEAEADAPIAEGAGLEPSS